MSGDDEVGYGKPPKKYRFQKGNKAAQGRKKRKKGAPVNMSASITKAMATRVKIRIGGRVVTMSLVEVAIRRLVESVTTGKPKDLTHVLGFFDKHAALAPPPVQETRISYHRAPGATVELPGLELWKDDEE